jgi:hypothetical protein
MPDPRKPYLVAIRGSDADAAPLEAFLAEAGALEGVEPSPLRDPRYARVQLTEAEAAAFREKYRDTLIIEADAPLTY